MAYVRLSGPKDRRSPRLRPTIEQDVDLSAVSVVVDVSSGDGHGRQQCPSNFERNAKNAPLWAQWAVLEPLEYCPLSPAGPGSGRQPSGIKHENRQSVARGNLRNRAKLRLRQCIGLERTVIGTALCRKPGCPTLVEMSSKQNNKIQAEVSYTLTSLASSRGHESPGYPDRPRPVCLPVAGLSSMLL
jgi:hypothetical protein